MEPCCIPSHLKLKIFLYFLLLLSFGIGKGTQSKGWGKIFCNPLSGEDSKGWLKGGKGGVFSLFRRGWVGWKRKQMALGVVVLGLKKGGIGISFTKVQGFIHLYLFVGEHNKFPKECKLSNICWIKATFDNH